MKGDVLLIFLGMVFTAVFLLAQGLVVPVFGEGNKMRKRLQQRLGEMDAASGDEPIASLLRAKYLRDLSPLERQLESLPGMEALARIIEQSGQTFPAYRVVLNGALAGFAVAVAVWLVTRSLLFALAGFFVGAGAPFILLLRARKQRMDKFEEQLPEAIDSMKRALRAGHPFAAALKLVAEDMDQPIAKEFEQTFADINYGNDVRRAMLGLLQRMPSMTVMALVTSVLVQKETGGNLVEILDQLARVIRGRFRFHRRVRTLSAEGRLSAWILALVPLVMFAVISILNPKYLPPLLVDPTGQKLIAFGFIMGIIGIFWIRRVIRIDV